MDIWHDRAVFHFLTTVAERAQYRAHLLQTVKPAGAVIIATFALDGPERCSGLPVARYSAETLARNWAASSRLMEAVRHEHQTPWGAMQPFVYARFRRERSPAPILDGKDAAAPAVFAPLTVLREARRQRQLPGLHVPAVCVLDPDGDIVRWLKRSGTGTLSDTWACYHSEMYEFELAGSRVGVVGCAVGAPYAVLVAEQMFASGCEVLFSITSAGQIGQRATPPYFVLVNRALRDEGTSYHYMPVSRFAEADPATARLSTRGTCSGRCRDRRRGELDDGRALPRDRSRDRGRGCPRRPVGRDGVRGPVRVCQRQEAASALPCPCDEHDGTERAGIRER